MSERKPRSESVNTEIEVKRRLVVGFGRDTAQEHRSCVRYRGG